MRRITMILDNEIRARRAFNLVDINLEENSEDGTATIEGYAVVFESETVIGNDWWIESIARDAIQDEALEDVVLLVNHDDTKLALARSRKNNTNSTLQLEVDEKGLKVKAILDIENNTEAKNLYSAVKRGDVSGMSFMFQVAAHEWSDLEADVPRRKITEISRIFEVSAVNFPAYKDTEIYARQESDTLENEKKALESARSALLVNNEELDIAKRKALFKIKNLGGNKK
jgi:HK97 family phage prohead protease